MRPTFTVVVVAGLVLGLAGACSSKSAPSAGPTPTAEAGGTLTVATAEPVGVPTDRGFDTNAFDVLDQIYEPLVRYGENGVLQPALATSWEVSTDGRVLTFHLRPGVMFSDGTPFDGAACKSNFDGWLGKDDYSFLGINSASASTPDASTCVLTLKKAYYPALNELAELRPMRFMSPTSFAADGRLIKPIGTGPYAFDSDTPDKQTVLVRNDRYWGGKPALDRVVFKVIPDAQARLAALQAGEVDLVGGTYLSPLAPEQARSLDGSSDVSVLTKPSTTNLLLTFNTARPALAEVAVRHAINLAFDRQSLGATLFNGLAPAANGEFPPNVPDATAANASPRGYDPAAAKQLLEQAGWTGSGTRTKAGKPLALTLVVSPTLFPQAKALTEAMQDELKDIGVAVTLRSLEATAYKDAVTKRDYDLVILPTFGAPYDPFTSLLGQYISSAEPGSDGRVYSARELDALIPTTLASTTQAQRDAGYAKIFGFLRTQWATAPLLQTPRLWAVGKRVHGFALGPTDYDLPLSQVTVDH